MPAFNAADEVVAGLRVAGVPIRKMKDWFFGPACLSCLNKGQKICSNCNGRGIVPGGGPIIAGASFVLMEPCRRCIGTGTVECESCGRAGRSAAVIDQVLQGVLRRPAESVTAHPSRRGLDGGPIGFLASSFSPRFKSRMKLVTESARVRDARDHSLSHHS